MGSASATPASALDRVLKLAVEDGMEGLGALVVDDLDQRDSQGLGETGAVRESATGGGAGALPRRIQGIRNGRSTGLAAVQRSMQFGGTQQSSMLSDSVADRKPNPDALRRFDSIENTGNHGHGRSAGMPMARHTGIQSDASQGTAQHNLG